ncbi:prolipoprotein diacylglyceryl transferase [Wenxinia saemankumensis]|uniref:Phosphatidylglycerol--prolipoprotein diacylglyceryl transferase n=1 Tax=Wenxinia saemankumensis TaxID=1447782 RepID=A0A1M6BXI3_9RHOB|nr:prolipoprotein diacylglyceryl transferase [Wenxinia saemankumensis]SHI53331.1 Prolipoprotein diacylglyceryl transferase [Wenxinia saemankumensis]
MQTGLPFPDISPDVFTLSLGAFSFTLRWYALAYIVGILIGWRIALAALRRPALWRDAPPMTGAQFENLMTWIILGVIAGGRLGYVLFYQPGYYLSHPWEIPFVWQGGMSFHGGFLGVVAAIWGYARAQGLKLGSTADVIALGTWPGLLLGRIANFVNAELWGRPTDLPWGVIFPGPAAQACATAETLCARHPSQLYEAALEGVILGAMLLWLAFRAGALKAPWLLTGVFLAGYGAARFAVEFVRQPDAQFVTPGNPLGLALHVGGYGLTMGQLLSLPMLLVGAWLILRARRRA